MKAKAKRRREYQVYLKDGRTHTAINCAPELYVRLKDEAARYGVTMARVACSILEDYYQIVVEPKRRRA